ncbi:tmv resistance protein n [Quercus suber]|uniref:Tmv resistance protein n n=1 Tax=Quercus suber TaxID=58331 RepID=A0AAW0LCH3_QUESU
MTQFLAGGLLEAIEDSAASIVIISPNYASSRWCLEELAKICECRRLILPVFYGVDPSDVRRQTGPFEEHFRNHEGRFGKDKIEQWRNAMKKAGEIAGFTNRKVLTIREVDAGTAAIKGIVNEKQVLVVLDDVDNINQLNALIGNREWFYEGSRIIITTRDIEVLSKHLVTEFYEGTRRIEGIVLDFEKRLGKPLKDPSGDTISWYNLQRNLNFTSAVTYLKERYKRYIEDQAEKEMEVVIFTDSLKTMDNLRLLQINYVNLEGKFKYLPVELKWLQWKGCPMKSLPSDFCPHKVAVLDLSESKIEQLWGSHNNKLPQFIGKLFSLKELSLNHSSLEEIPDSIGSLENLEKLSLMCCKSLNRIPDSIGNLKSLSSFFINGTAIKELPWSIGSLSNLKHLSVGENHFLSKLPDSIGGLDSIVELKMVGTSIIDLPEQIGALKVIQKLEMKKCESLRSLPKSIGCMWTLTTLIISEANISEMPESIGMLENLIMLRLDGCKQLYKLPASIGNLKSLQDLSMKETAVTHLRESFGMLSSLMILKMAKKPHVALLDKSTPEVPVICSTIEKRTFFELPTSFSNLSLLSEFDASSLEISGKIPDDFEMLSSLEFLNLGHNNFYSLPSSLRGLSILKKLILHDCKELKSLPPLPSSLLEVNVENCIALESVSDLSNLESLSDLNLTNCEKVVDIPGLECLKSLRRLYMSGCNVCSSIVSLRNMRNLSMPGSKIPSWFSQKEVRFTNLRNREINGVIIGVVVSLNQQVSDDLRYRLPAIVDIQAEILKQNSYVYKTTLNLNGVPKTNEDQIHLCRYPSDRPIVWSLKDGYKIQVITRTPPIMKGVELKNWGIYLVFDGDDDYEGDEESLNESQQSISERLATFFNTFEEEDCVSKSVGEVEEKVEETTFLCTPCFFVKNLMLKSGKD